MGLLDFFRRAKRGRAAAPKLKEVWSGFQQVLASHNEVLALIGNLEEILAGRKGLDLTQVNSSIRLLHHQVTALVAALQQISGGRYQEVEEARSRIQAAIEQRLAGVSPLGAGPFIVRLEEAGPQLLRTLGGKAGNLVQVKNQLGLPVPEGMVATLSAYKLFMEQKLPGTGDTILNRIKDSLADLDLQEAGQVGQICRELQELVQSRPIPPEVAEALVLEARRLAPEGGPTLTVRSSGGQEDAGASFAGQYKTFLGVAPEEVPERWRQVVASQFGEGAVIYFKLQGLMLEDAAMGVLVQRLVAARVAGTLITRDAAGEEGHCLVSATWGLGADLVAGKIRGDEYVVAKETGDLVQAHYSRKTHRLVVREGRLERVPVGLELEGVPALEKADLKVLAAYARQLDAHCGCPHCVEWVKDEAGKIFIVQSRHLVSGDPVRDYPLPKAAAGAELDSLLTGQVGSPGAAAGEVYHLAPGGNPADVPSDAVLVVDQTTPELAPLLPRVAALVTRVGSTAGHLILVAREYGVPALVNVTGAGDLPAGDTVTVDAYHGLVYPGRVEDLLNYRPPPPPASRPLVLGKVREVADLVIPLNLVDRRSPAFRGENCRTYRDISRFAYDRSCQVMFSLMDDVAQGRVPALKLLKLKTALPLNLHLVDLGDGLKSYETPVDPEDIVSRPMRALWQGISYPGITWAGPVPVNVGGFLHVLGQSAIRPPEKFWDKTYAIVGANYVNYACRLGYHFQSVDSYIGEAAANNYINFTFKGGAADDIRRMRRIRLIDLVLEHLDFTTEIFGDAIRARFRRRPAPEMEDRLALVGRLMAYVRQMDMLMKDDNMSQILAARFLAGHYERPESDEETGPAGNEAAT